MLCYGLLWYITLYHIIFCKLILSSFVIGFDIILYHGRDMNFDDVTSYCIRLNYTIFFHIMDMYVCMYVYMDAF